MQLNIPPLDEPRTSPTSPELFDLDLSDIGKERLQKMNLSKIRVIFPPILRFAPRMGDARAYDDDLMQQQFEFWPKYKAENICKKLRAFTEEVIGYIIEQRTHFWS